jgi:hypothetical protein
MHLNLFNFLKTLTLLIISQYLKTIMEKNNSDEENENNEEIKKQKQKDEYFKHIIALGQRIIEENEDKPFWSTGIIGRFLFLN